MATPRQISANQRNALRSTGPRSLAGKGRSQFNAVQHGLTARHALLPGENRAEFEECRRAVRDSLRPNGAVEQQLTDRVASLLWRMRRIEVFEIALIEWAARYYAGQASFDGIVEASFEQTSDVRSDRKESDGEESSAEDSEPDELPGRSRLGQALEALLSKDLTGKLGRYEMGLQRQLAMTLKELRALAGRRSDEGESATAQADHRPEEKIRLLRRR